jgi:hypothetical protein
MQDTSTAVRVTGKRRNKDNVRGCGGHNSGLKCEFCGKTSDNLFSCRFTDDGKTSFILMVCSACYVEE